jgi:hypothetical protein
MTTAVAAGNAHGTRRLHHSRAARLCLALAIVAMLAAAGVARAVDPAHVDAAYMLNFVRYAAWPDDESTTRPYVVVVVGGVESFRPLVELAERAPPIRGRAVRIRRLASSSAPDAAGMARLQAALQESDAVFVAESHAAWAQDVVAAARQRPLLTVGVGAAFARTGGMIALLRLDDRIVFTCNTEAIRHSTITVSSRVIQLSHPLPEHP